MLDRLAITFISLLLLCSACSPPSKAPNAAGGVVIFDGKSYSLIDFDTLVNTNSGWGSNVDSPSLYNGQRVATIGWVWGGCSDIRWSRSLVSPRLMNKNPFTVHSPSLFYLHHYRNSFERDISSAEAECKKFEEERGPGVAKFSLFMLYGEFRNGKGSTLVECRRNSVEECNHLWVDGVQFAGMTHRDGDPDSRYFILASDIAKFVAEKQLTKGR